VFKQPLYEVQENQQENVPGNLACHIW